MDENPYQSPLTRLECPTRKPCGFLAKTNPNATPRSVARQALIYALFGTAIFFIPILKGPAAKNALMAAGLITLFAFVGAVCEWQVSPDDADDGQP